MVGRATHLSLAVLVGVMQAGLAVAQTPRAQRAFASFHASLPGEATTRQPSTRLFTEPVEPSKRTYWLEGGLIGALVLGVTGYVVENAVASSACSDTGGSGCHDYRTVAVVGGAALGFLIGSLIGRGHAKGEPATASPPD